MRDQGEWSERDAAPRREGEREKRGEKREPRTNHWREGGKRKERLAREKRRKEKQPTVMEGCPLLLLLTPGAAADAAAVAVLAADTRALTRALVTSYG